MIELLAQEGFQTVPETARQFIESELAKGRTIDEIRADRAAMTRQIYDMWVEVERGLGAAEVLFLDRGLPDSFAFFRFAGMDPNAIVSDCLQHRYASVFMLDRLPYLRDGVRAGDDETADYFDAWMERDYSALGYKVIRVPVLPPDERLAFVIDRLSERGLR
jgi:predicted ATPase